MDSFDARVIKWSGAFGLLGAVVFLVELPLWILPGTPPPYHEAVAHADFLTDTRVVALARVLLDILMYMALLVFWAGLRRMIVLHDRRYEWAATLMLVAGAVWWAVSLVADGLAGAAAINTVEGHGDPTIVRTLVEATLLIYNGAIAFAVTGLFMAVAGYCILGTGALPRWIGWLSWLSFALCMAAIPAMFAPVLGTAHAYNTAGWGPTIVANIPPLIWIFAASIAMLRWRPSAAGSPDPALAR